MTDTIDTATTFHMVNLNLDEIADLKQAMIYARNVMSDVNGIEHGQMDALEAKLDRYLVGLEPTLYAENYAVDHFNNR